jgi:hypothetical protein
MAGQSFYASSPPRRGNVRGRGRGGPSRPVRGLETALSTTYTAVNQDRTKLKELIQKEDDLLLKSHIKFHNDHIENTTNELLRNNPSGMSNSIAKMNKTVMNLGTTSDVRVLAYRVKSVGGKKPRATLLIDFPLDKGNFFGVNKGWYNSEAEKIPTLTDDVIRDSKIKLKTAKAKKADASVADAGFKLLLPFVKRTDGVELVPPEYEAYALDALYPVGDNKFLPRTFKNTELQAAYSKIYKESA